MLDITRKQQAARRRFEAKELIIELKSKPCVDCGKKYKSYQMDFVRKNDEKHVLISQMLLLSIDTIRLAISKCDLVCANCGRTRIWNRQRSKRAGPT
jgi:hypothetical protein